MTVQHLILWLLLIAVFAGSVYWHVLENRKLAQQWRKDMDAVQAQALVKFAWMRSLQLLFVLACFLLFVVAYVWQLGDAQNQIADLDKLKTELSQELANLAAKNTAAPPSHPSTAAIVPPSVPTVPPAPSPSAQTAAAAPPTATAPSPVTPPQPASPANAAITELYNPEARSTDQQSELDALKKRYENILVIYRYFNKCGRTEPTDYSIILSALQQEITTAKAPPHLQSDILSAAEGSYREMYSRSPCNGAGFTTLYTQYRTYIKDLAQRYPLNH